MERSGGCFCFPKAGSLRENCLNSYREWKFGEEIEDLVFQSVAQNHSLPPKD